MRKFKFQFEAVEKVRAQNEKMALKEYSERQRDYFGKISMKGQWLQQLDQALERRSLLAQDKDLPVSFQLEEAWIVGTKARIQRLDQEILRSLKRMNQAYERYLKSKKEKKVIEVLRESAQKKFNKARKKKEQRDLEDSYVMRARLREEADR